MLLPGVCDVFLLKCDKTDLFYVIRLKRTLNEFSYVKILMQTMVLIVNIMKLIQITIWVYVLPYVCI